MMRTPNVYSADEIKNWDVQSCGKNGLWTLARPMSWPGINLQKRISSAWMVFTGKADVLVWLSEND
jgi:hypothetical protein